MTNAIPIRETFKTLKTSRGFYLDLELIIFVKNFEIYGVNQSL
jgi:hypothetical protein